MNAPIDPQILLDIQTIGAVAANLSAIQATMKVPVAIRLMDDGGYNLQVGCEIGGGKLLIDKRLNACAVEEYRHLVRKSCAEALGYAQVAAQSNSKRIEEITRITASLYAQQP